MFFPEDCNCQLKKGWASSTPNGLVLCPQPRLSTDKDCAALPSTHKTKAISKLYFFIKGIYTGAGFPAYATLLQL